VIGTADEELIDIGTDQLIVLHEYQDDVVFSGAELDENDDEEKRELVCR
jgi:hypothetical protein